MFSGFSVCTNSPIKWHSRGQRFGSTNSEKVKALYDRICKIAQGAALMTETQVEIVFDKACSNVLSDSVLEQLLYDSMRTVPLPQYTEQELAFAAQIKETYKGCRPGKRPVAAGGDRRRKASAGPEIPGNDHGRFCCGASAPGYQHPRLF